jgi:hypothetical protein
MDRELSEIEASHRGLPPREPCSPFSPVIWFENAEDSLEQASALKYVETTAAPYADGYTQGEQ